MSIPSKDLLHSAKELLAAALLELFPGAALIDGSIDEVSFSYDFFFEKELFALFGEKELLRVEDQMRLIAHQNRPITTSDMMRQNAQELFRHHGFKIRAEVIGDYPENIVSLFKMGSFFDVCPETDIHSSGEIKHFKLLKMEKLDSQLIRIEGSCFATKEELKEFLKKYKEVSKKDPHLLGPKLKLFDWIEGMFVVLPGGEPLKRGLLKLWRTSLEDAGFQLIHAFEEHDPADFHTYFFNASKQLPIKVASFGPSDQDHASIFVGEKEVLRELISSLHFIEKLIKIFAFETRIYLIRSTKKVDPVLKEALEKAGLPVIEEQGECSQIEFRLVDLLGRGHSGPTLRVEKTSKEGIRRLAFSVFGSLETWMCRFVEFEGVKRIEFKD